MITDRMKKLLQFAVDNGPYLLCVEVFRRLLIRIRSLMLSSSLHAKGLRIGSRSYIRGARHMSIGRNFRVGDDLWLEALPAYGEKTFSPRIVIGSDVSISRWTHITCIQSIEIGARTLIGSKVLIADHNHGSYQGLNQSDPAVPPAKRELCGGGPGVIEKSVLYR